MALRLSRLLAEQDIEPATRYYQAAKELYAEAESEEWQATAPRRMGSTGRRRSLSERRLSWDEYFMQICNTVAQRSTCNRASVGAVIVRNRNILATGYNGSPAGLPHCTEVGCLVYSSTNPDGENEENCFRTIHAEINAIAQAAKSGVSIQGSAIYITHSPCIHCLKVLINTGIERVYFKKSYKLGQVRDMVEKSGIRMEQVDMPQVPSA